MSDILSEERKISLAECATKIISAYLSVNKVEINEIKSAVSDVYGALCYAEVKGARGMEKAVLPTPPVPINKSVEQDYIVCLEDGLKFRSLKRHLKSRFNLSPDEYRKKWNLPSDYPMVAPSFAAERSKIAKKVGLGTKRRKESNADHA